MTESDSKFPSHVAPATEKQQNQDLEIELKSTQKALEKTVDELATANQGLKAFEQQNILINAELQSRHAELALSKQELRQLNQELEEKLRALEKSEASLAASVHVANQRAAEIEAIYHSAPIGLGVLDTELRYVRINDALADINGVAASEHLGRTVREVLGDDLADAVEPLFRRIITTGEPANGVEYHGATPKAPGVERDWLCSYFPLRAEGGAITGLSMVVQDITERKQVEAERENLLVQLSAERARLETVLQQMPVGVIIAEAPSGRLSLGNERVKTVLRHDFKPAQSIDQYGFYHGFHPDGRPYQPHEWPLARALQGEVVEDERIEYQGDDGERRIIVTNAAPVRDAQGAIVAAVVTLADIHDQAQAQQTLEQARHVADQANRSKSEFLANMSHEIRTPMTAILGYADVLAAYLDSPDDLYCIDNIKRNGRHLLDIVNDILDLSKIEAGKLPLTHRWVALDALINEVYSIMQVRAREKALPLAIDYEDSIPAKVETDPVRLRQILINLLSSAIKFTDAGEVRLRVSLQRDTPARLRFDVTDTGIGMSAEQQQQLFAPFTQLDASLTRRYGGAGLGLAISRRLAHMLGGEIKVESKPRQGSTFSVIITAGDLSGVPLIQPRRDYLPETLSQTSLVSLSSRVLVVDDRCDIRYLVQHNLEEAGAEVITAADGRAALQVVAQAETEGRPVDMIIMDMQMPIMDGYEATARLRAQGFVKPIVAFTAGAMLGEREKCLQIGCSEYLSKPVKGRQLVELISNYEKTAPGADAKEPDAQANGSQGTAVGIKQPRRVMVIDDSVDAAKALAAMLGLMDYQVQTAHNGYGAITMAQSFQPQVVITDISLPDIDGYEVVRRLKALPELRQTRFIAVSGYAYDQGQMRRLGFDHYLQKPANMQQLITLCSF